MSSGSQPKTEPQKGARCAGGIGVDACALRALRGRDAADDDMKNQLFFLVITALITSACSGLAVGAGDSEICVAELTRDEALAMQEAAREWNDSVGTSLLVHDECQGGPKSWRAVRRTGTNIMGSERPGASENIIALYYETFLSHDDARVTSMHELGHILGIGHLGPEAVMFANRNTAQHLTDEDIDAYWTLFRGAREQPAPEQDPTALR